MDFENALMSREPNDILTKILGRFILNLKPQTRNLSIDQISTTVVGVLSEYLKSNERTVFWDDNSKGNVDPFEGMECGFFAADWDLKLKILRQLVELQLTHAQDVKAVIDRAWGVVHHKHKKEKGAGAADSVPERDTLDLKPFGQDSKRGRYWIADDSPRLYISTNPWKMSASFKAISSTREEYLAVIDSLKSSAPAIKKGQKKSKIDTAHLDLVEGLQERVEKIDTELTRVARVRKKIEQNRILMAQAELRETRTRRQAQKPDYVYYNQESEDEYQFAEEQDDEFEMEEEPQDERKRRRGAAPVATRRSTRAAALNANGKREGSTESSLGGWRGERRSARLGFQDPFELERAPKRARTEESTTSVGSADGSSSASGQVNENETRKVKVKRTGAAGLKPNEIAMEQIAGKKRSKFWVYAVEPIPEPEPEGMSEGESVGMDMTVVNGHVEH
ncbi:hypothetical protein P691DRAFT_810816 [Macrolepiota fuliginosa MF-IS2]|uniref:WHIM1 domain-containing protein n=1 Tax=Macrolepiota fuliginosa MF-IS2 TaxID=1400762 RepID=A0A9P6CAH2_9AGAR|nr:hypothetical protein P691DRAFT_810816 [Macrolepiota fuliginosa MF-IS2]